MSGMPDREEVSVLIPAAGVGERLGLGPRRPCRWPAAP